MVVLNRIYTRTGDDGSTALGNGERVAKTCPRVEAYGTVDEANAAIGLARALMEARDKPTEERLARIQNDLFDLGADLCVPDRGEPVARPALRITDAQVDRLEEEIDVMNTELSPLRSFVLPGGRPAAAQLHVARTVTRRAERAIIALAELPGEPVGASAIKYVNRLSDFLFVASRYVNDRGAADVLWVPGQNISSKNN
jgi:cob(I)alamin adenosyltransferase